jgi:hypothetical protein
MNKIIVIILFSVNLSKGENLMVDKIDLAQDSWYSVPAKLLETLVKDANINPGSLVTGYYDNLAQRFTRSEIPKGYYSNLPSYWKGFDVASKSKNVLGSLKKSGFTACEIRCDVTSHFSVTDPKISSEWYLYLFKKDKENLKSKFKEESTELLRCRVEGYLSPPGIYHPYTIDGDSSEVSRLLVVTSIQVIPKDSDIAQPNLPPKPPIKNKKNSEELIQKRL